VKLFENRVPRRIFVPKRDDVTGEWRKLHKEELYDLYCLSNIIWIIKDKIEKHKIGWACDTYMKRGEVPTEFWWGNLRERAHLEDPGVDGRIILRWIFRK